MAATVENITINQGETFSQQLTTDPVVNLTGGVGTCQIRQKASSQYPVLASPTVTLTATPTDGKVTLALTAAQSLALPVYGDSYLDTTEYVYDVDIVISGVTTRIFHGTATVSPTVTR